MAAPSVKVAGSATGIEASTEVRTSGTISREWHVEQVGIGHEHHDDCAVERREIAHHPENRLLLRTDDMRGADEFGGASELGARSGRRNFGDCLAAPYQCARKGLRASPGLDRDRFACEHRLIEQDLPAIRRTSAATTPPSESFTTSPGTSSEAGTVFQAPSRRTEADKASLDFRAASVA